MRSIRRELVLGLSISTAVLAALAGVLSGRGIESRLRREFDDALLAKAHALAALTEQRDGVIRTEFSDEAMPEFSVRKPLEYFQVWSAEGRVIDRSRSSQGADLVRRTDREGEVHFADGRLPDGRAGRFVGLAFVPMIEDEEPVWQEGREAAIEPPGSDSRAAELVLARGTEDLESLVRSVYIIDLGVAITLALLLAALVAWVVRRGFAPLESVARALEALDERKLGQRVDLHPPVQELEPIVRRLNLLLERLEAAFDRERRFSGDVAHELRTPVAELRTLAEVGGRWSGDPDLARDLFRDAAKVAARMERSVGQMRALAEADAGQDLILAEEIELGRLIEECVRDCLTEDASGTSGVSGASELALQLERPLWIATDRDQLAAILRNLFSNAAIYCPEGGRIEIAARATPEKSFMVEVSNEAPHLEPADVEHLFDRFWRKDASRTDAGHSGLGLALVRALCGRLSLAIAAELDGTTHRLTLRITGPRRAGAANAASV